MFCKHFCTKIIGNNVMKGHNAHMNFLNAQWTNRHIRMTKNCVVKKVFIFDTKFNCFFQKNCNSIELNFCSKQDIIITSSKMKNRILNNVEKMLFIQIVLYTILCMLRSATTSFLHLEKQHLKLQAPKYCAFDRKTGVHFNWSLCQQTHASACARALSFYIQKQTSLMDTC